MNKKKILAGNLKMNLLSQAERNKYLELLEKALKGTSLANVDLVLFPPIVHLEAFQKKIGKKVALGGQNVFSEQRGSYTGEISPAMIKNFGGDWVLVGHSERRRYFSEKNEEIALKLSAALKSGLAPILCVGESRVERDNQETLKVISRQLKDCLVEINRTKLEKITIAYEPIWAVGTDITPTTHEIMEAKVLIQKVLVEMFGKKYVEKTRIIYGGSVHLTNLEQVCLKSEMEGALIGRESLSPHEFIKMAKIFNTF